MIKFLLPDVVQKINMLIFTILVMSVYQRWIEKFMLEFGWELKKTAGMIFKSGSWLVNHPITMAIYKFKKTNRIIFKKKYEFYWGWQISLIILRWVLSLTKNLYSWHLKYPRAYFYRFIKYLIFAMHGIIIF